MLLGIIIGVMVMSLLPVSAAQANSPSLEDGVQPVIIPHFGGDDCADPSVGTMATHSFMVSTPANGIFIDPATGVTFTLSGITSRSTFNWSIGTAGWAAFDVVVKGGTTTNHYDYQASSVGIQTSDTVLHAPPKQNRYDNLSHITFCYDVPPLTISGTKYHDRDSDGLGDAVEETLGNWTINAYKNGLLVATDVTDANGFYELAVGPGDFVVCETLKTEVAPFGWKQTFPSDNTDCTALSASLAAAGHDVTVTTADVENINFRNVRGVMIGCGDTVTLDEDGKPSATVTVPSAGCSSADQFVVFDVGVDPNEENVTQFVVFGGNPNGTVVFSQTINWLPEDANYDENSNLIVPPTLVVLEPGGLPVSPGAICASGQPNGDVPDCRATRVDQ